MSDDAVTLKLSRAEALVLFDWVSRLDEKEALPIEHEAEQRVIWSIEAQLEKTLVEPLKPDYENLLLRAREEVVGPRE